MKRSSEGKKPVLVEDDRSAPVRRKGKRQWCRGRAGRPHDPEWRSYAELKRPGLDGAFVGWKILVCRQCGKYLDHDYPWGGKEKAESKEEPGDE